VSVRLPGRPTDHQPTCRHAGRGGSRASLLPGAGDLDALQPASFTLATLAFDPPAAGTGPLTFPQAIVDDAFAVRLAVDTAGGGVTVSVAVPEPATSRRVGLGLTALALKRGRARAAKIRS
jgi:hypothetical protein